MAYGDRSTTKAKESSKGGKRGKEEMGMWLSLFPPGFKFRCPICNKRFKYLQALGGHQNSHRTHQIKIKSNDVNVNLYKEKKERKKKVREVKPIDNDQSCNCTSDEFPMVVANDHDVAANYEDLSGIDLNLHLGFGPHKKVINLFDFMSVNEVNVDGVGASGACEIPGMSLRIGGSEGGVGVGCGNLKKASISNGKRREKGRKKKFTSNNRVDLNLKL